MYVYMGKFKKIWNQINIKKKHFSFADYTETKPKGFFM